jgi:hypothetical protein
MGAEQFTVESRVTDSVAEAFKQVREDALYDCGHRGYTGTIAEKHGYVVYTPPADISAGQVLEAFWSYPNVTPEWADSKYAAAYEQYNDKWGFAVAMKNPNGTWIFTGWASS